MSFSLRYVILRHDLPPEHARDSHWDLMLERPTTLQTWCLADEPRVGEAKSATELPAHRLAYLDYEGPVSGNRGHVTQWDRGRFRWQIDEPNHLVVELVDGRMTGRLELVQTAASHWTVRFSTDPSS